MNQITLIGKVVGQVSNFNQKNGEPVTKFRISVGNRSNKNAVIDCVAWKQTSVIVKQEVREDDLVCVIGKLNTRESTQGGTLYEVSVDRINLILPESYITDYE